MNELRWKENGFGIKVEKETSDRKLLCFIAIRDSLYCCCLAGQFLEYPFPLKPSILLSLLTHTRALVGHKHFPKLSRLLHILSAIQPVIYDLIHSFVSTFINGVRYLFILKNECIQCLSILLYTVRFSCSSAPELICDPALLRPIRYSASLLAEPSIWLQSGDVIAKWPHWLQSTRIPCIVLWTWPKKDFVQKASYQWIIKRHFWCVLGKTLVTMWWNDMPLF